MTDDNLPVDLSFYTIMSFVSCCCCGGWISLVLCLLVKHNMALALQRKDSAEFYKWKGYYWWAFFAGWLLSMVLTAVTGALTGTFAYLSN